MITLDDYLQGRDVSHALEFSPTIRTNAIRTVEIVNKLLILAKGAGVPIISRPDGAIVNSGWRPPSLNAATPGAALKSLHMTGEACDLHDPKGYIDEWCTTVADTVLRDLGLWLEHKDFTPAWSHTQTRPPGSKSRIFRPR